MNPGKQTSPSFWTPTSIGLAGSAILLVAAIASALYNQNKDDPPPASPSVTTTIAATQPSSASNAPAVAMTGANVASAAPANPAASTGEMPAGLMEATFNLLNGRKKSFADYSGKVLVVDLWATWCGPCRQEIPHLVEIARQYKSKGVEVIGLTNEDPVRDAGAVKEFSKEFKINYPIGWADPEMQAGLTQGRSGIPQTLIIGRDGRIRKHFVGFSPPIVPQMKAALDEAVAAE